MQPLPSPKLVENITRHPIILSGKKVLNSGDRMIILSKERWDEVLSLIDQGMIKVIMDSDSDSRNVPLSPIHEVNGVAPPEDAQIKIETRTESTARVIETPEGELREEEWILREEDRTPPENRGEYPPTITREEKGPNGEIMVKVEVL